MKLRFWAAYDINVTRANGLESSLVAFFFLLRYNVNNFGENEMFRPTCELLPETRLAFVQIINVQLIKMN